MSNDSNNAVLTQLAEVQGQLTVMTQLLMHQKESINQRLDDMREAMDTRFDGVEKRLQRVEDNERKTALMAAGTGAVAGALVSVGTMLLRLKNGG